MQQPPGWGPPGYPPPYQQGAHGPPARVRWFHGAAVVILAVTCCFPLGLGLLWTSPAFDARKRGQWTVFGGIIAGAVALLAIVALGHEVRRSP